MIHKVNVVKKIAFLLMTMALAGAIVACQGAVKSPATVAKEIGDIEFDVGDSAARKITLTGYFNVTDPKYNATPSKKSVAAVSVSGAVLTVTPTGAGTVNVEVTAEGDEGKVSQTFTVTVNAAVQPPVVTPNQPPATGNVIGSQQMSRGTERTFDLTGNFTDPDGDDLTYTPATDNADVATAGVAGNMLTIEAVGVGDAEITVTATDPDGATASQNFHVKVVVEGNTAPYRTNIIPATYLRVDDTETLTLTDYFADGEADHLTFTAEPRTDVVTAAVVGASLTITADAVGSSMIVVSADDGNSDELARQSFMVTVKAKINAPSTSKDGVSTDVSVLEGSQKEYDLKSYFDDPEGDTLTFSYVRTSDGMVATGAVSGSMLTIDGESVGKADITVSATDSMGNENLMDDDVVMNEAAEVTFKVTVTSEMNKAPTAVGTIDDVSIEKGAKDSSVNLSEYFEDDGDMLEYEAKSSDNVIATAMVDDSMLKITANAVGGATITVTASDDVNVPAEQKVRVTVTYSGPNEEPHPHPIASGVPRQMMRMGDPALVIDLNDYFRDPDRDPITYTAVSAHSDRAMATIEGSMVTITAVAEGLARIDITATDKKSLPVREHFYVDVKPILNMAPTPKTGVSMTVSVQMDKSVMLDPVNYFEDPEDDQLSFKASGGGTIATITVTADDMLKIMGNAVGKTTITVTADDKMSNDGVANDPASVTFNVTVTAKPVTLKPGVTPPSVDLDTDADGETVNLSTYFTEPDDGYRQTYKMGVYNTAVARAAIAGSMLTITPVGPGTTTITVTAENEMDPAPSLSGTSTESDGGSSAELRITVTVQKPDNVRPRLKADIGPFRGEAKQFASRGTIDLDKFFTDPDGSDALLTYRVTQDKKKEIPETAGKSVIAVGGGAPPSECKDDILDGVGVSALPDGTDLDDSTLWICLQNVGTAKVEIVAVDAGGKESDPATVMITVGSNTPVTTTVNKIYDQTADADKPHKRLKIGETRKVVDGETFKAYFVDVDLESDGDGDRLTFEVAILPSTSSLKLNDGNDLIKNALKSKLEEGDDGYGAVEAMMTPMDWDGDPKAKFTLSLTGRKGTKMGNTPMNQLVAIIATDMYGAKVASTFKVGVNHSPIAMGAQAKGNEKTLSGETMYQDLIVGAKDTMLVLVEENGGYFSDGDGFEDLVDGTLGSGAGCVIKSTGGTDTVAIFKITETKNIAGLEIIPKEVGFKSVTIACKDTFGVNTLSSTLTVQVTGVTTGSRQ